MAIRGLSSKYVCHEKLVAPVRPYPELWRIVVGMVTVGVVVVTLNLILLAVVTGLGSPEQMGAYETGSTTFAMLVLLSSFVFVTFGVALAVRQLQHRGLQTVIGDRAVALLQFWRVLRALIVLGAVLFVLPPYDMGAPLVPNVPFAKWVLLLPLSLGAVLIQTSAEEVLFRGYLQQSLAARFNTPWIWMGIPSFAFAVGHYAPAAAGENALLVAGWAFLFGILSADLTARAGTLGPAIAMHFANNATALLIISLPDGLGGLALYLLQYDIADTGVLRQWLMVDFAVMIVSWLTARLALRR
ncbi:MAG: CPBP family intramembrane glutamic endopeptidase [Ruegeria sp.]